MAGTRHGVRSSARRKTACRPWGAATAQRGAILPMVGLTLVVVLGFAGLVIDIGGMFVAKTELQSALDSCSLSAAAELDGAADSHHVVRMQFGG